MKQSLCLFACLLLMGLCRNESAAQAPSEPPGLRERTAGWLRSEQQSFIENKGQFYDQYGKPNPAVKYLLCMEGLKVQLRRTGFSYDAWTGAEERRRYHRVDIELEGANPCAAIEASDLVNAVSDRFIGGDGKVHEIRQYSTVTYKNIYPGIDLEFVARKGKDKPVEYNFIVHPGADASQIRMHYASGGEIALKEGMIRMELAFGLLEEQIPLSYTKNDRKSLAVQYKSLDEAANLYAFNVPDYDRSQPLIIDPTPSLKWATYFGGVPTGLTSSADNPTSLAIDPSGNVLMAGISSTQTGLATAGAYQTSGDFLSGSATSNGYCVKYAPDGTRLWSTYFGTNGSPAGAESLPVVSTDAAGNVFLLTCTSTAAPTTAGVHDPAWSGTADPYLLKLNANGNSVLWATYIGVTGNISAFFYCQRSMAMYVLPSGDVLVGGLAPDTTTSPLLGFGTGYQHNRIDSLDGYLVKINGGNGAGIWGTYFGGPNIDYINAVTADAAGNIYIGGSTLSTTGVATAGAFQPAIGGLYDMFLAKLNSDGSAVQWSTYYGGPYNEGMPVLDISNIGQLIVAGFSTSPGLATAGTFQQTSGSAILASFSPAGARNWATYYLSPIASTTLSLNFTPTIYSSVMGVAVDEQDNIYLSGITLAPTGVATPCAPQTALQGTTDLYAAKFTSTGQRLWGTYYGGTGNEGYTNLFPNNRISSFAYAGSGEFYLAASTSSTGMATPGADQTTTSGIYEGLITKFDQGNVPDDVTLIASVLSPMTQASCILGIPDLITGNTVTYTTSDATYHSPVYYQWQSADALAGPWTDLAGEVFRDLQPSSASNSKYYRRIVLVDGAGCTKISIDTSAEAVVNINASAAPVAGADGTQWYVCGAPNNTVTLNGSASGGTAPYTYQWFAGGNMTTVVSTAASYSPAPTLTTTYTVKVTDAAGCSDIDQATIVPAVGNAGPDKSLCQGSGGVQIGTPPIANSGISYSWTLADGSSAAATLSCTSCAQPIANPAVTTSYVLTMTVTRKDNTTCSTTDTVTVTPVDAPNSLVAFAGTDRIICAGSTVTLGGASAGTGFSYTWSPATYLSAANIYNPTFDAGSANVGCGVTYIVTAAKLGCAFTDQVKVTVIDPSITHQNETWCGPLWINQETGTSNCATATYSWSVISGTGSVQQTTNNGASGYLYSPSGNTVFRRTTTVNGVSCTADVTVSDCGSGGTPVCYLDIDVISSNGCPKNFGSGTSFKLTTNLDPNDYNFQWSPANLVDNPTAAIVTVTSLTNAVITCTATNKFVPSISCTDDITINNPAWSIPSFVFPNQAICANTATNIGIASAAGYIYLWIPATGLNTDTSSDPLAMLTGNHTYIVRVKDATTDCILTDTVVVTATPVIAAAGNDRTVCNGGTVTLGTAPSVGTSFNYSWQPAGAAWTNGTGPNDPQPQVLFASATQTFILTVSDPVSGCSSIDSVTLSNSVATGEYAGAVQTVCPGSTVQLGRAAEPSAVYNWTLANGNPATGLSCTTCANPILTAPDTTATYKVQISYPGCSLPIEDTVRVNVLSAPAFSLIDRNYCPTTPVAIGFGTSGNPTAPANVSIYTWTPATGLSSTTAANPTSTVAVPTDYIVRVTYANGCVRRDTLTVTPDAIADAGTNKAICQGASSIQIGTPAIPGATYSWTGGSIVGSSTIAQPTVNPATTTTYTVSVTSGACTAIDTVVVYINIPPDFELTGTTSICEGGAANVSLTGTASPSSTWQWVPATGVDNSTSPNTTIMATDTTTYRLIQTSTVTGCSNYRDIIVVVKPNTIAASVHDTSTCATVPVALPLTVTSSGSYQYVWTPATGLNNIYIANPTATLTADQAYAITVTDNATQCGWTDSVQVTIKPELECLPAVNLSGNVFRDRNGLKDAIVNTTSALGIPTGLYVSLIDTNGTIIATTAVASNGTYDFASVPAGLYRLVLHQNPGGSATQSLPAGWMNTGENLNAGTGSDFAADGILIPVTTLGTDVTNANFGIQRPPVSDPKSYTIDQPTINMNIPLNGTYLSTGPGTSTPDQFTGNDAEDGLLDGASVNKTVVISAAPDHGELWYNGALVISGQQINNYDPALLSFRTTGGGYLSATFQYAFQDSAGVESAPVSYTLQWGIPLFLHLSRFDAVKMGAAARLSWVTAQEGKNSYFRVERSSNAITWTEIGKVKAIGEGSQQYNLTDAQPLNGVNYYRLAMVDGSGNYQLSPMRQLNFGSIGTVLIVPNPAHNHATIMFSTAVEKPLTIQLLNSFGQNLATWRVATDTRSYPLLLDGLARGVYYLNIETASEQLHLKLMLQ